MTQKYFFVNYCKSSEFERRKLQRGTAAKMNFDDYEQLPTPSIATNMIAGAAAGVLEHCVMYPMDSIKVNASVRNRIFYSLTFHL